jgi:hypothetical protein
VAREIQFQRRRNSQAYRALHQDERARVTPNQLLTEFVVLLETVCHPRYDRVSGACEPITPHQWDVLSERFLLLCAKTRPREVANGNNRSNQG